MTALDNLDLFMWAVVRQIAAASDPERAAALSECLNSLDTGKERVSEMRAATVEDFGL